MILKKINLFEPKLNKIRLKCDRPADSIAIGSAGRSFFFKPLNYPKSPDKHPVLLRFYQSLLK